jgi:hypothetical protein
LKNPPKKNPEKAHNKHKTNATNMKKRKSCAKSKNTTSK